MAWYRYRGRNGEGALIDGTLEAASEDAAANQLFARHISPLDIAPLAPGGAQSKPLRTPRMGNKVKLIDLIFFTRQMYSLLRAGIPIFDTLQGLRETTPNPALATVIGALRSSLDAGSSLSAALRQHPAVFPTLYVNIVEIGETSGSLEDCFARLIAYLEQEHETRNRLRAAIRYPKIVLSAIALAMLIVNVVVIPTFAKLFAHFHAQLPLPTRFLIAVSDFTVGYWYLIAFGAVTLFYAARRYVGTPHGRYEWDRRKLAIPVIGGIIYRASLGRFAYALALCVKTGVPWSQGMSLVSQAMDNDYLTQKVLVMRDGVERGEPLAYSAAATGLFPPLVLQMLKIGEQTGDLDRQLSEVSDYYEREVDYQLRHLNTNIEPVLLLILGVMVLILALGIFLPMWGLASAALHHQ